MEYIEDDKEKITLVSVLQLIEDNTDVDSLCWSILFLDVIGYTYDSYSANNIELASEFEGMIRNTKGGYKIKWKELKELCAKFENIVDCSIVASRTNEEINYIAEKCENDFDANFKMNYVGIHILDGYMEEFCSKDKILKKIVCDKIGPFPFFL